MTGPPRSRVSRLGDPTRSFNYRSGQGTAASLVKRRRYVSHHRPDATSVRTLDVNTTTTILARRGLQSGPGCSESPEERRVRREIECAAGGREVLRTAQGRRAERDYWRN